MNADVSVIVTIYNVDKYLYNCITSIINQSYSNIQIILVDDGSSDLSGIICDQFSEKDDRIVVIHKKNEGLVAARKTGINVADSEYICWVDGDDWVEEHYVENLYNNIKNNDTDLVVSSLKFDIGKDISIIKSYIKEGIYEAKQIFDRMLYAGIFYEYGINPHLPSKIFKKKILEPILYAVNDKITIGEDAAVTYPYILKIKKLMIIGCSDYHYVQHNNSMTKAVKNDKFKRLVELSDYLKKCLYLNSDNNIIEQLFQYEKYLLLLHAINYLDNENTGILSPYGGIDNDDRVIIYGAGGMGQALYRYVKSKGINIIAWVDKNYMYYRNNGMNVSSPISLLNLNNDAYDEIIIATISNTTADVIRNYLIANGVCEKKIKWIDDAWLNHKKGINILF